LRLIEGGKPGEGDPVRLKRTVEAGHIVHVFSDHPFRGDVVVLGDYTSRERYQVHSPRCRRCRDIRELRKRIEESTGAENQ
jgi:hypothetical protein